MGRSSKPMFDGGSLPAGPRSALLGCCDPTAWRRPDPDLDHFAPAHRANRVAVLATHSTDLLAELLPTAARCLGIHSEIAYFGLQQPEQVLLSADALQTLAPDYVVLSATWEDLALDPARAEASVRAAVSRWSGLWRQVDCCVVQDLFVPPAGEEHGLAALAESSSNTNMVRSVNQTLRELAGDKVLVVDSEQLANRVGLANWRDSRYWYTFRQAVDLPVLPEFAKALAGTIAADLGTTRRCVVVDLDNTIWDGVLGEDGVHGVRVDERYAALQGFLLGLHNRGIALAVASKNDHNAAKCALAEVRGMVLQPEHFAVVVANWQHKTEQLREIATRLQLGLDSLLFLDDNPAECARVARELPEVDVVWTEGSPEQCIDALTFRPTLTARRRTPEDDLRGASYSALAQAERARVKFDSLDEFLDTLDMIAEVRQLAEQDLTRAAQLLQRTNQFNLTTRRYNRNRLSAMTTAHDWDCLTLRLRDRYGDHGLVGLLLQRYESDVAEIDTLILSCRVIGRTAERRLLHAAGMLAKSRGCARLRGVYACSPRNSVVSNLYSDLGFIESAQGVGEFDLARVAELDTPHIRGESE